MLVKGGKAESIFKLCEEDGEEREEEEGKRRGGERLYVGVYGQLETPGALNLNPGEKKETCVNHGQKLFSCDTRLWLVCIVSPQPLLNFPQNLPVILVRGRICHGSE